MKMCCTVSVRYFHFHILHIFLSRDLCKEHRLILKGIVFNKDAIDCDSYATLTMTQAVYSLLTSATQPVRVPAFQVRQVAQHAFMLA